MDLGTTLRVVIERLVRRVLGRMADQVARGVVMVILATAAVVLGFAVFVVLGGLLFGFYALLGQPDSLAGPVGVGWFFGSLLVVAVLLLRGHRWLSRLLTLADIPAQMIDPYDDVPISPTVEPKPSSSMPLPTFEERLAAADATHAPDHLVKPASRRPSP